MLKLSDSLHNKEGCENYQNSTGSAEYKQAMGSSVSSLNRDSLEERLSVLISVQPKWCEKIARGEKTIEIRKNRPKIEAPFKCYIYRTKGFVRHLCAGKWFKMQVGGTVIGEFTCKEITPLHNVCTDDWNRLLGDTHERQKGLVKKACLTEEELKEYAKGKTCYAWDISDLQLYNELRHIGSFWVRVTNKIWSFKKKLERAPQSWCYVDEI